MKTLASKLVVAVVGLTLTGCTVEHEHARYVERPGRTVSVEPGWYYDREYRDHVGRNHDRVYYYYDGHRYDRRDRLPRGLSARERAHDDHLAHLEHLDRAER